MSSVWVRKVLEIYAQIFQSSIFCELAEALWASLSDAQMAKKCAKHTNDIKTFSVSTSAVGQNLPVS